MDNTAVVIVCSTFDNESLSQNMFSELLFTPSIAWVADALKNLGYSKAVVQGGSELASKSLPAGLSTVTAGELAEWLDVTTGEEILVVGADAPLLDTVAVPEALKRQRTSGRGATLFSGKNSGITGAGWYSKDTLTAIISGYSADFALENLLEELKEKDIATASYETEEYSLMTADSPVNINRLSQVAKLRIIERHLLAGVNIPLGDGVIISPTVSIAPGSTVLSGTIIRGLSTIGSGCEIGPNSYIENSEVGDNNKLISSYIESSRVGDNVTIGPMSRVRPGSSIDSRVKIGNFVEVKNSLVGEGTSIAHLTYIGDSDIGSSCNIGCGVVTVNYDGAAKHRSVVGDGVFIGCNCNLVAPVTLADGAYAAAGTTITEDVPGDSLVIGRVRQTVKEGWAGNRKFFKKK